MKKIQNHSIIRHGLAKGGRSMIQKFIYFDHAATTPLHPEAYAAMEPYLTSFYGNPSSIYTLGRDSKKAIEAAREQVAKAISASAAEIYFTSGGTESDNWAVRGAAYAYSGKGKHIITSRIEHHAVLHTCKQLEREGFEVTYIPVDAHGTLDLEQLKKAIRQDTILISIMLANNEVGTLQPTSEIGEIAKAAGICFHTDAVQAVGSIPVDVDQLNVDLLSLSGHKFYGPKGVGALYIRKGTKLRNLIDGGAQEKNKRPGTENVPSIVGLGKAIELAVQDLDSSQKNVTILRDQAVAQILKEIPYSKLNGHPTNRLPGSANFSFDFVEGESILLMLDKRGIAASSGSACASGSLDPSHVLIAMGIPHESAHGSVRFSFGKDNTSQELETLLKVLPEIVSRLRERSPLYQQLRADLFK
jgi:cysteine desulfurase